MIPVLILILLQAFKEAELGDWVKKPMEQDDFQVTLQVSSASFSELDATMEQDVQSDSPGLVHAIFRTFSERVAT